MFDPQEIENRIKAAYPQAEISVKDLTGGKDHFEVHVTTKEFQNMNALKRHRAIYDLFKEEVGGPIHALSLKLKGE